MPERDVDPAQLERLRDELRALERVVVAFSGGADSAFLAWVANDTLGPSSCVALTAVSPSLAPEEHDDCAALAREGGLRWEPGVPRELESALYVANRADRGVHCQGALMEVAARVGAAVGARRDARARVRHVRGQRRRPVLPLQERADGRGVARGGA